VNTPGDFGDFGDFADFADLLADLCRFLHILAYFCAMALAIRGLIAKP
jgi:hypothetical protein